MTRETNPELAQQNNQSDLRRRLTRFTRSVRLSIIPDSMSLLEPQSSVDDQVFFEGRMVRRKRIVLLAAACSAATCTMCPLPNEALDTHRRAASADDIIEQFNSSFRKTPIDNFDLITVYNNGNFFSDVEMPPKAKQHIYACVRQSLAKTLVVESLPQFINPPKIEEVRTHLGNKQLVVAIGLQSSDDLVRNLAINSTCTKQGFERAVRLLQKNGYLAQAFLMVKPPFLTENEAVEDTVNSIVYLSDLDIKNPILCATRVAPNTLVSCLYREGRFRPPWLWTIVEVLEKSAILAPGSFPRVAVGELKSNSNSDSVCPANCPICSEKLIAALEQFNSTRNLEVLNIPCSCLTDYRNYLTLENASLGKTKLTDRIAEFLNSHRQVLN